MTMTYSQLRRRATRRKRIEAVIALTAFPFQLILGDKHGEEWSGPMFAADPRDVKDYLRKVAR